MVEWQPVLEQASTVQGCTCTSKPVLDMDAFHFPFSDWTHSDSTVLFLVILLVLLGGSMMILHFFGNNSSSQYFGFVGHTISVAILGLCHFNI